MMGAIANSNMGMQNPQEKPAQGAGGQQPTPQPEVSQARETSGVQEVREQRQQAIQDVADTMGEDPMGEKALKDSDPTGTIGSQLDVMA